MGFLSSLTQAVVKTAILPISVITDIATLGKHNITKDNVEEIQDDLHDAFLGEDD